MDDMCEFVGQVYDPPAWICFCLLWDSTLPLTDGQLAMRTGMEIRKVRSNLSQLNNDGLIERIGAQLHGRWIIHPESTVQHVIRLLKTMLPPKQQRTDDSFFFCEACQTTVELIEIIDQLSSAEDIKCPHCSSCSLKSRDDSEKQDLTRDIAHWIDRLWKFQERMNDWKANPWRPHLPTLQ